MFYTLAMSNYTAKRNNLPKVCSSDEKCEKEVKKWPLRDGEVQVECLPEMAKSSKSKNHNLEEKLKIIVRQAVPSFQTKRHFGGSPTH